MPIQWKQAIICPIYKKGDISECNKYQDTSLTVCNI